MSAEGIVTMETARRDVSEDARNVMWETTHGDGWEHGVHWLWSGKAGELYTVLGLQAMIDALHAACLEADAITLHRWLPEPAPEKLPAPPYVPPAPRKRHHLPYADADDEIIYETNTKHHAY